MAARIILICSLVGLALSVWAFIVGHSLPPAIRLVDSVAYATLAALYYFGKKGVPRG